MRADRCSGSTALLASFCLIFALGVAAFIPRASADAISPLGAEESEEAPLSVDGPEVRRVEQELGENPDALIAPEEKPEAPSTEGEEAALLRAKRSEEIGEPPLREEAAMEPLLEGDTELDRERPRRRTPRGSLPAPTGYLLSAEVYISDLADRALLASAFGYGIMASYRWKSAWSVGLRLEHDLWVRYELGHGIDAGAISASVVVSRLWVRDRIRTSLMLGPSFLLFDTGLDDAGSVGFYGEARPLGVVFNFPRMSLSLEPFTISLVAPVLRQIPLVRVAYRSVIQMEFGRRQ